MGFVSFAREDLDHDGDTSRASDVESVVAALDWGSAVVEIAWSVSACGGGQYRIRTMPLYTGTGDGGETGLVDGTRVLKCDKRVVAYGDIDELNATLGVVLTFDLDSDITDIVSELQQDLFALGAHLADPSEKVTRRFSKTALDEQNVVKLETWIDTLDAALPPLKKFLLPGGGSAGAALHVARGVCRRAERHIIALGVDAVPVSILRYVNRLSDLLFVLARTANRRCGTQEREW